MKQFNVYKIRWLCFSLLCIIQLKTHAQGLQITAGANMKTFGAVDINVNNAAFVNQGSFDAVSVAGSRVSFTGNAGSSIAFINAPGTNFYNLQVNKSGGILQLNSPVGISNNLQMTTGNIDISNYKLDLLTTGMIIGENAGSYITGTGSGYISRTANLVAPIAVNPGNLGVEITSTATPGNTIIQRYPVQQTTATGLGIKRYYNITAFNNSGLNASVKCYYLDAELMGLTETNLGVYASIDGITWNNLGKDATSTTLKYVQKNGINALNKLTLAALPTCASLEIPAINITTNTGNTICPGATVIFTATISNGGSTPIYQWKRNGVNVGTNSNTYSSNNLANRDSVWCVLTSNLPCTATPTAQSNKVGMTVAVSVIPVAPIQGPSAVCLGSTIQLTDATDGGVWASLNNRATVNTSGLVTGASASTQQAIITYTVSNIQGCTGMATRNITINPLPSSPVITVTPGIGSTVCNNRTFSLTGSPAGIWSLPVGNGTIATITPSTVSTTATLRSVGLGSATLRYTITDVNGCSNNRSFSSTVVVCSPRGNNTAEVATKIYLSPNPAKSNNMITIYGINKRETQSAVITISDMYGHELAAKKMTNDDDLKLNIGTLSKGMYLITITTASGTKVEKLVVE